MTLRSECSYCIIAGFLQHCDRSVLIALLQGSCDAAIVPTPEPTQPTPVDTCCEMVLVLYFVSFCCVALCCVVLGLFYVILCWIALCVTL